MVTTPSMGGGMASMTSTLNMRTSINGSQNAYAKASKASNFTGSLTPTVVLPAPAAPPPPPAEKMIIPLSARRSPPLDMSTVERRGQPTAAKEADKKLSRPHGLEEAPTFRPTDEQFRNPMEYIKSIASEGRKYGILKIIPPDGWNPEFAIDTERFHFRTRRQELNMAEGGTRANLNYLDQLAKFHKQKNGTNLNRFPSVDKRPLDLYKLRKFVEEKGGFEQVCRQKRWAEIGRDLGYSGKIMSSLSTSLKNSYQKWLQPYEEWLRDHKPSVLQQNEIENGGPYTPSPAATPAKGHHQTTANVGASSPAIRASAALNASIQSVYSSASAPIPSVEPLPPRLQASSGFTAVNAGGFTAVNVPVPSSSFSAINAPNGYHQTSTGRSTPQRSEASPMTSTKNTPDLRPFNGTESSSTPSLGLQNINMNLLKRQLSSDADSGASGEADASGRRSKRHRTEAAPTVTGSYMIQPRLSAPRLHAARDRSQEKLGDVSATPDVNTNAYQNPLFQVCEVCGKDDDPTATLLCDSCEAGYHLHCLDPPLQTPPEYDWHCQRCLVGTGDFGFDEGKTYSLGGFQEKAKNFKDKYFASRTPFDPALGSGRSPSEEEVEKEFWRLTESLTERVEVEYGADIHSTTHGSGFPTMELQPYSPYSTDSWNLNVLPLHKESLFRHIKTDISGMTVPWLYAGMCFSTFCWHSEDHYTYSANYQHFGATKTWYGIPGDDAERFEAAMRDTVPELFEQQPDLLFQLVTLLQPEKLLKAGVRVYALDQRAGQFVITFPQAYHAGFNHGFNFNEAVNFAPYDWEPYGATAIQRFQDFRRQPVFCHEELLWSASSRDHSIKTARWLGPALQRMMDREMKFREHFTSEYSKAINLAHADGDGGSVSGTHSGFPFEKDATELTDDDTVCSYCKCYCYMSRVVCKKTSRIICLLHAGKFECCGSSIEDRSSLKGGEHIVHLFMTDEELTTAVRKVVDQARTPELWAEKLDKVLADGPKPALKSLRSLVSEGEKINVHWELEGLPDLKAFVERCNEWVEEATNYITRKQQNRRKNERAWRKSTTKFAEVDEREKEFRNLDNIRRLLATAYDLSFDCPELEVLQERAEKIARFRKRAHTALNRPGIGGAELEELIEDGKSFNVDLPEVAKLETHVRTVRWFEEAKENSDKITQGTPLSLQEVTDFIKSGKDLGIHESEDYMTYFTSSKEQGEFWEGKAKELMSVENVNFQQLDALSKQASKLPVSKETLTQIDAILQKQRDAQDKILSLYERSKDPDFRKRPKYSDVRDAMEELGELNSKPPGTLDLEKEQKRHEDWMRRGKKLFGKANAPLHILLAHMIVVEAKNDACLDLRDQPRMPVEPSSREHTPEPTHEHDGSGSSRDVFCICRRPEAGMMIECELCHEWYHGKCLKIARGKVKEDDKYTCPICDYRLKIPRDAARPKLEELQAWQDDLFNLPFQPEEEEILNKIVNKAAEFRASIASLLNPLMSTPDELPVQRFYLRKIEGADVLLVQETNFLRQELHKWAPVAPEPPKMIDMSLSTRKPRPTKQQKLMATLGISNPDDLPEHLRPKAPGIKKKDKGVREEPNSKASSNKGGGNTADSHTPPGLPHGMSPYGSASRPSTAMPTEHDRHSTFSFDAMAGAGALYAQQDSPMFATSLHHGLGALSTLGTQGSPASPVVRTAHLVSGIDPQLENMFGHPSSSMNVKEDLDPNLRQHVYSSHTAAGSDDRSDHMDLFGSLTHDPVETPFGGGGFDANPTFEESIESNYVD